MDEAAVQAEGLFRQLADRIKQQGNVTAALTDRPYRWETYELQFGTFDRSPTGPFDWIKTNRGKGSPELYVYLRPDQLEGTMGFSLRIDFRHGDNATLTTWLERLGGGQP